jgi:Periplasmic binding protein
MGKIGSLLVAVACCMASLGLASGSAGAADSTQGVSATTINLGIPYIDFASLKALGVNLDEGNWADAYNALIANINAHGGVNGRKLVPFLVAVNPTGSTAAVTACTQLVEDDHVFVVLGPEQVNCYVNQHHVPAINGLMQTTTPGSAANFTLAPPFSVYDPVQLAAFAKRGVFKGKKVALFGGMSADTAEMTAVRSELQKLHVAVVQTAIDSAPATDQVAEYSQAQVIAQHFQQQGVKEVVAVGTGSALWPKALSNNQSSYNPPWVGTDGENTLGTIDTGSTNSVSPQYVKNMTASVPAPSYVQMWKDPAVQKCVSVVKKAYPSDAIATPTPTTPGSGETYEAVVQACQNLAMFSVIAAAAGKHLTTSSFTNAGYGLRNVTFPGMGGPVSFGKNNPAAVGPIYLVKYNAATNTLAIANTALK